MNIVVLGAGSIGCYCGGCLLNGQAAVTFIGRDRIKKQLLEGGLYLADLDGFCATIDADRIIFNKASIALKHADIILVTVKNNAIDEVVKLIKLHAPKSTAIISMQNGIGGLNQIKAALPDYECFQGMVGFNVVWNDEASLFRSSEGHLILENTPICHELKSYFDAGGIPTKIHNNMESVMWGKLCLNLNNALNMISGLPLKQQLEDRTYRKILAACIAEALVVTNALKIKPAKLTKVPVELLPTVLNLPNFLFKKLAANMLKIDPLARSSMWDDMQLGRPSEVNFLNGAIQKAGVSANVPTPINDQIIEITHKAFAQGKSPQLTGADLQRKLQL